MITEKTDMDKKIFDMNMVVGENILFDATMVVDEEVEINEKENVDQETVPFKFNWMPTPVKEDKQIILDLHVVSIFIGIP